MFRSRFAFGCVLVAVVACAEPAAPRAPRFGAPNTSQLQTLYGVVELIATDPDAAAGEDWDYAADAAPRVGLQQRHRLVILAGQIEGLRNAVGSPVVVEGNYAPGGQFNVVAFTILQAEQ